MFFVTPRGMKAVMRAGLNPQTDRISRVFYGCFCTAFAVMGSGENPAPGGCNEIRR